MRDFGAIFQRAKLEASKKRGDSGSGGDKLEESSNFNCLSNGSAVTTAESPVVTVVTQSGATALERSFVTTVTTAEKRVVTRRCAENIETSQLVGAPVTNGTTVTTEKGHVLKKSGADAIRRAELRNSMAIHEPQRDPNRCHVCGGRQSRDQPLVPIMTAVPDRWHWLHSTCWPEHVQRITAKVEALMAEAERQRGAA